MEPRTLRDGDLVLRAWAEADEPALRDAFADPDTARWNPGVAPDADLAPWWTGRNDWSAGTHASWAVAAPAGGGLLGSVSVFRIDADQATAEIGYFTVPAARGRRVATRAVGLAAAFAFRELGLFRVQLFHAALNVASCHVAVGAGFTLEGTLRESYRYGDGARYDEHLHARLGTD